MIDLLFLIRLILTLISIALLFAIITHQIFYTGKCVSVLPKLSFKEFIKFTFLYIPLSFIWSIVMWVIDQMVRKLLGTEEDYEKWIKKHCYGEDGENTYEWDTGIAP